MKIYTEGARFYGGQIDRIDNGFIELGHSLTTNINEADLIYSNNPWYDNIISQVNEKKIRGKIIFNILDAAPHCHDFPIDKLKNQTKVAHAITTISNTVKKDLETRIGISASVIYNPIKKINRRKFTNFPFRYLFCGRVNDPEKRTRLGMSALYLLGVDQNKIAIVGSENPGCGQFLGPLNDESLSDLFCGSKFSIIPTRNAFLGLPIFECIAAERIPVICNDLDVRQEFLPSNLFPEYDEVNPDPVSIAKFIAKYSHEENYLDLSGRLYEYWERELKEKFSNKGVAGRIINLYERI